MSERTEPRWVRLLMVLGLVLAGALLLLLFSGAFSGLGTGSPPPALPAPATATVTRVPPPRVTVEGLMEGGSVDNAQEGQGDRPPARR